MKEVSDLGTANFILCEYTKPINKLHPENNKEKVYFQ
jgi:hypothetical protein